jgi:hypothetical protein
LDVFRVERDLVIRSHQVNFGDGATGNVKGIILYESDGVSIGDSSGVQFKTVIPILPPTVALLEYEMEGGPWSLGASCCAVLQNGVELRLGHHQAVRSKAAWAAGYWRTGCSSDVVRGVVLHHAGGLCWSRQVRNFARRLFGGMPLALVLTLGTDVGAVWPGVTKDVTPLSRRLFLQSTRSSSIE